MADHTFNRRIPEFFPIFWLLLSPQFRFIFIRGFQLNSTDHNTLTQETDFQEIERAEDCSPCTSKPRAEAWAVLPQVVIDSQLVYLPLRAPPEVKKSGLLQPCFRSCALVGSSGVLRNTSWGARIDRNDAIFRLNNAPVVGYERDIGSRTTIRILHDFHLMRANINKIADTESHGMVLLWPPQSKPNDTRTGGPSPRISDVRDFLEKYSARKRRAGAPIARFSPELFGEVYRVLGILVGKFPPTVPSTGFIAVITALQLCREVTVFGLSWGAAEASKQRHQQSGDNSAQTYYFKKKNAIASLARETMKDEGLYYDKVSSFGLTHHNLVGEKEAFARLSTLYRIEFL
mmetsp:Transcript_42909/g.101877  ORF Transcript_42909/g.101877 Transcript_42909/m.101877 type:complete len:346 (-) Transcript_42909:1035-2072(-)